MTTASTSKLTHTVKMSQAIEELATAPGLPVIVVRCEDSLYAIAEKAIASPPANDAPLNLEESDSSRLIAKGVEQGFTLNAASRMLVYIKSGRVTFMTMTENVEARVAPTPRMDETIVGLAMSDDGMHLMLTTRDDSDRHFTRYALVCVDLKSRESKRVADLSSVVAFQTFWSGALGAFVVLDRCAETLWRIESSGADATRIPTDRASGRSITSVCPNVNGEWLALLLHDPVQYAALLMQGVADKGTVRWESIVRLATGMHANFRWRPGKRVLACHRTMRRREHVDVVNALGVTSAKCELPREWMASDLAWSSAGDAVYSAGIGGIHVWRPFDETE